MKQNYNWMILVLFITWYIFKIPTLQLTLYSRFKKLWMIWKKRKMIKMMNISRRSCLKINWKSNEKGWKTELKTTSYAKQLGVTMGSFLYIYYDKIYKQYKRTIKTMDTITVRGYIIQSFIDSIHNKGLIYILN